MADPFQPAPLTPEMIEMILAQRQLQMPENSAPGMSLPDAGLGPVTPATMAGQPNDMASPFQPTRMQDDALSVRQGLSDMGMPSLGDRLQPQVEAGLNTLTLPSRVQQDMMNDVRGSVQNFAADPSVSSAARVGMDTGMAMGSPFMTMGSAAVDIGDYALRNTPPFVGSAEAQQRGKGGAQFSPEVQAIQKELAGRGINVGPIDGLMGPKTGDAIKTFQSAFGLPQTGILDQATTLAVKKLDPSYKPSAAEQAEIDTKAADAKARAAEAERLSAETKSAGQWDQLKQRSIPYAIGGGLGLLGGGWLARRATKAGAGKVADFHRMADDIAGQNAKAGGAPIVGTQAGDDMIASVNAAYRTGGKEAPFTADSVRRTIPGTGEALAASAGQRYGGHASEKAMRQAIRSDASRSAPFAEAPRAADAEAKALAGQIMRQRSLGGGGDDKFLKDPTDMGKAANWLVPAVGATDALGAKTMSHFSDDPATKDAYDKLSNVGVGMTMVGGLTQKLGRQVGKTSPALQVDPKREAAVNSGRMRMDREIAGYTPPGTKSATQVRNPVGKQTRAEQRAIAQMGREARAANGATRAELANDPAVRQWLQQNPGEAAGKGSVARLRAFNEAHGTDWSRSQLAAFERQVARQSTSEAQEQGAQQLTAHIKQQIASGNADAVALRQALAGNNGVRAMAKAREQYIQQFPALANMSAKRINQIIRDAAR